MNPTRTLAGICNQQPDVDVYGQALLCSVRVLQILTEEIDAHL
jgi:hypothetical protein